MVNTPDPEIVRKMQRIAAALAARVEGEHGEGEDRPNGEEEDAESECHEESFHGGFPPTATYPGRRVPHLMSVLGRGNLWAGSAHGVVTWTGACCRGVLEQAARCPRR